MSSKPLVTVITAVYNGADWIDDALNSIQKQSFQDFIHLVVDDGSNDGTGEKVKQFASQNELVHYYRTEHIGAAAALNFGIRNAEGKYLAILDADDIALEKRLEIQAAYLDAHPEYGWVGGAEVAVNESQRKIWFVLHPQSDDEIRSAWVWRQKFTHSAIMVRKEALDRVGLYDESMEIGFDPELMGRIAAHYKVRNLPEPVVLRRHRSSSLSRAKRLNMLKYHLMVIYRTVRVMALPLSAYLGLALPIFAFLTPRWLIRKLRRGFQHEKVGIHYYGETISSYEDLNLLLGTEYSLKI